MVTGVAARPPRHTGKRQRCREESCPFMGRLARPPAARAHPTEPIYHARPVSPTPSGAARALASSVGRTAEYAMDVSWPSAALARPPGSSSIRVAKKALTRPGRGPGRDSAARSGGAVQQERSYHRPRGEPGRDGVVRVWSTRGCRPGRPALRHFSRTCV
jgi:hypothetical protein